MKFTCTGIGVTLLQWRRNGMNIGGAFTGISNEEGDTQQLANFTLFLDTITRIDAERANMTSRLVGSLTNLITGDRIACLVALNEEDEVTLDYTLRGIYYICTPYKYNIASSPTCFISS